LENSEKAGLQKIYKHKSITTKTNISCYLEMLE